MKSLTLKYVPFFKHNDLTRMQMASSHIRQAITLTEPELPFVLSQDNPEIGPPFFYEVDRIIKVYPDCVLVEDDGKFDLVYLKNLLFHSYLPYTFHDNSIIKAINVYWDGTAMLGRNLLTLVMIYNGYNFQDAIVISESAALKMTHFGYEVEKIPVTRHSLFVPVTNKLCDNIPVFNLNSVHKGEPYLIEFQSPFTKKEYIADRDYILVWKFPNHQTLSYSYNMFLHYYFNKVYDIGPFISHVKRKYGEDKLGLGLKTFKSFTEHYIELTKIYTAKAVSGDKFANRHGNKGLVKVLPDEKMPMTPYGRAEVIINPLCIPSRMNLGQLFEIHLTKLIYDARHHENPEYYEKLKSIINLDEETNTCYDTIDWSTMKEIFYEIGSRPTIMVYDPISNMEKEATVGWCYWMKLHHLLETKFRIYNQFEEYKTFPYDEAINKGQRFGEMETWALLAYGEDKLLKTLFTEYYIDKAQLAEGSEQMTSATLKFRSLMKALGIDIEKAYQHYLSQQSDT